MLVSAKDAGPEVRDRDVASEPSSASPAVEALSFESHQASSSLLTLLTEIQDRYHYLPHHALVLLGETLNIPLSQIYGVATFYNAYSLKPRGAHLIRVCMGTACHVRGAPQILDRLESKLKIHAGETTRDHQVTLETVNCLGACALGPITVVDNDYTGQMDIVRADRLLKTLARARSDKEGSH